MSAMYRAAMQLSAGQRSVPALVIWAHASAEQHPTNKVAVALDVRAAMQAHRKGKPIAFQNPSRPPTGRKP